MSDIKNSDIKRWLKRALKEDYLDISISREGSSDVGDGYMGDILFVKVSAEMQNQTQKNYNFVLKCSKKSEALRQTQPVKAAFENEIHLFKEVLPVFTEFQKKKGILNVFNSVPKYYGSCVEDNIEVIVLENLKIQKYYLCDRKVPFPTDHLRAVLCEYGKWHAISAAIQDQEPEVFENLLIGLHNMWKIFTEKVDPVSYFSPSIQEAYELVKENLSADVAEKLKNFKSEIGKILKDVINPPTFFSVIGHGDCWANNFMFKSEEKEALKVAILDWQAMKFSSPIMDVSYFIYACASKDDLNNIDDLLGCYYDSFSDYMRLLGSDSDKVFPFSKFLEDFRRFRKYGALITMLAVKVALSDKSESPDFAEKAESGVDTPFDFRNKNESLLRERMSYIVEHLAAQNVL